MNKQILRGCELPVNAKVYFKKDKFSEGGWRTVYPIRDEDGKFLWKNALLGGSQNLFWVLFIILLILGFAYVYNHDTAEMQKVVENPCGYCNERGSSLNYGNIPKLNISGIG